MADPAYSKPSYDRVVRLDPSAPPAPKYSMVTWYDTFNDGVWKVGPPAYDEDLDVFTTEAVPMQPGTELPATDDRSRIASYATEDGLPQVGEEWGTKAGDYRLRKGYRGFRITSQAWPDGTVNVVRLFQINPRKSSGSGSGTGFGGVVDIPAVQSISISGCTLSYSGKTFRIQFVNGSLVGTVVSSWSGAITIGPLPVTGSITLPSRTGTVSGTVGTCALSGTVTMPTDTITILSGLNACG